MIHLHTYDMDIILRNELLLATARRLTLYSSSGMNIALDRFAAYSEDRSIRAKGIFAYQGEVAVGWCLLTFESDGMSFTPTTDKQACVQIFVEPNHRRKGIGRKMLMEASLIAHGCDIKCYHWGNPAFFDPFVQQGTFQSL